MSKLWRAGLATLLFVVVLLVVYVLHARYFTVDVVLYGAMLDGVIACALAGGGCLRCAGLRF